MVIEDLFFFPVRYDVVWYVSFQDVLLGEDGGRVEMVVEREMDGRLMMEWEISLDPRRMV